MEQELYLDLRKGKPQTLEKLVRENLGRTWFLCGEMTMDSAMAVPLLLASWERALARCREAQSAPGGSFLELVGEEVLRLYLGGVEPDGDWEGLPPPQLPAKYRLCLQELRAVSLDRRPVYLAHVIGGVGTRALAGSIGCPQEEAEGLIKRAERDVIESHGSMDKTQRAALVRLFTEFKSPQSGAFQAMALPPRLEEALCYRLKLRQGGGKNPGKEVTPMEKKQGPGMVPGNQRKTKRKKALVVKAGVACAAVAAVAVGAALLFQRLGVTAQAASTTTYEVAAVSYGDVDTTISGSGTLTPLSQDTLTAAGPVTLTAVNCAAGDTVGSGTVIATAEDAAGEEVAMVMGADGFTMGIAVDEQDIALIQVGQEAAFTIDAVEDGEVTGAISQVSYNGSSNGSATAYQITAQIGYVEGVYPGMSASAQIVVEESGEGLLVPVEAVQTSGDDSFLYLAPSDGEEGAEYEEGDIDLSELTQVTVETGDSDGSYLLVTCDELSEGDLILVPHLTSTATGSGGEEDGLGGFSGMPGGMDFGDFDFSNFDPSAMPQGGSFPGMGGGSV